MNKYNEAIEIINGAKKVLIGSHVRPDGDSVGSMVALKMAISQNCDPEQVDILMLSEPGDSYRFLVNDYLLWDRDIDGPAQLDDYDLVIIVDTSAIRQLPGIGDYLLERTRAGKLPVIVIDHHLSGDEIGNCRIIDSDCAAAGQLVYQLIDAADWDIDEMAANALFVAIATDTGWFRFSNTAAQTLFIAGDLIACGAEPDILYQQLYLSNPPERMALLAAVLATLEFHAAGRIASMYITNEMLKDCGAARSLIENIVNEPMQIGTVIGCGLFVRQENGDIRGSLRSKDIIDVNVIANKFDGGGHARAAGLTISGSDIIAARDAVVAEMELALPAAG
ncbi:MAG: bifunctional oligoribonuclease/PAP phosphatase NrnA [Phycisphaerae bacterium]|nr:bifunctional oligoribonuclease/PAP phosphatase NrnA [Phycisphaerae bacterium]